MTSNVGSEAISKGKRSIGFLIAEDTVSNSYASMKALVMEELKAYFRPELLNRIDEVVVFRSLEQTQVCSSIINLSKSLYLDNGIPSNLFTKGFNPKCLLKCRTNLRACFPNSRATIAPRFRFSSLHRRYINLNWLLSFFRCWQF